MARWRNEVLGVFVFAALGLGISQAQSPTGNQPPAGRGGAAMMAGRGMMADMAAQSKKLDELVAAMNAAKGADKVDRVAAVLTELVAQHNGMRSRMMAMPGMMMPQPNTGAAVPEAVKPAVPPPPAGAEHDQHHPDAR